MKDTSNQTVFAVMNCLSSHQHGAVIYDFNSPFYREEKSLYATVNASLTASINKHQIKA